MESLQATIREHVDVDFLREAFQRLFVGRRLLRASSAWAYSCMQELAVDSERAEGGLRTADEAQQIFHMVQGELEQRVEHLSDLIARRRLRNPRSEIVAATNALSEAYTAFSGTLSQWASLSRAMSEGGGGVERVERVERTEPGQWVERGQ